MTNNHIDLTEKHVELLIAAKKIPILQKYQNVNQYKIFS